MVTRTLAIHVLQGLVPFARALRLQNTLADRRLRKQVCDTLIVLQHPPVYTVGKRATFHNLLKSKEELEMLGAEVHHIARGGDVTWHGPGQAVLYPVVSVRELGCGARRYVEGLEDCMVHTAAEFNVQAYGRAKEETGVWVGHRKIGAVGVRISRGISTHGIAFNVDPDLSFFDNIVPCGIVGKGVTSLAQETEHSPGQSEAAARLAKAFSTIFEYQDVIWHNGIDWDEYEDPV